MARRKFDMKISFSILCSTTEESSFTIKIKRAIRLSKKKLASISQDSKLKVSRDLMSSLILLLSLKEYSSWLLQVAHGRSVVNARMELSENKK